MRNLKVYAVKSQGELKKNPSQSLLLRQWKDTLKNGQAVEIEYRAARSPKTNKQVKTVFGLLINSVVVRSNDEGLDTKDFLKRLVETDIPSGNGLTSGFLYNLFLTVCPVVDKDGRRITLSKMDIEQAGTFIDECMNLMASCGIYIPDPDPEWREKIKETDNGKEKT